VPLKATFHKKTHPAHYFFCPKCLHIGKNDYLCTRNKDCLILNMSQIIIQDKNEQFAEIVSMIQHTRNDVLRLANASLIDLYWKIGKYISSKIAASEWGDGVVRQLADYIERTSPEAKGFSDKNLWRMKQFYETYNGAEEKLSPLVRQICWTIILPIF
jgi:hypothetical protein